MTIAKSLEPYVCGGTAATFGSCCIHPIDLAKVSLEGLSPVLRRRRGEDSFTPPMHFSILVTGSILVQTNFNCCCSYIEHLFLGLEWLGN